MAVKIRLARGGAKKKPYYRVVVADVRAPRDGRFIEKIGTYNPMLSKEHKDRILIDIEKAKSWLSKGAQPTDKVYKMLADLSILPKKVYHTNPKLNSEKDSEKKEDKKSK